MGNPRRRIRRDKSNERTGADINVFLLNMRTLWSA
jgi:hypothetical protein